METVGSGVFHLPCIFCESQVNITAGIAEVTASFFSVLSNDGAFGVTF